MVNSLVFVLVTLVGLIFLCIWANMRGKISKEKELRLDRLEMGYRYFQAKVVSCEEYKKSLLKKEYQCKVEYNGKEGVLFTKDKKSVGDMVGILSNNEEGSPIYEKNDGVDLFGFITRLVVFLVAVSILSESILVYNLGLINGDIGSAINQIDNFFIKVITGLFICAIIIMVVTCLSVLYIKSNLLDDVKSGDTQVEKGSEKTEKVNEEVKEELKESDTGSEEVLDSADDSTETEKEDSDIAEGKEE